MDVQSSIKPLPEMLQAFCLELREVLGVVLEGEGLRPGLEVGRAQRREDQEQLVDLRVPLE